MNIKYHKSLEKDLRKINDKKIKQKLKLIILEMKETEVLDELKSVKKLAGHPNAFRMRIGLYRLGFYYENNTLILSRFVKRNDIYKLFP
ncbi:plasmid stabilization protein [Flagellimonas halotolerans]|uniref:Plasmid stabilization protein n=1 Tax=Flagellimonas halotolerans TaxID=3112164 RepID=A0ABU6IL52_9FLAO|nr:MULTISPECIES: plasmid stabilization protein [unclassified Allomuricauda]MEC3963857.1 plasmid stabilization protein [Muricauda sp. SYSU M86414]MEC4263727.1 plasmid stabilization protein [Muricauda sp. SYSU M84420]